ncbi:MAG: hypothetical protein ACR2G6_08110 [Gemmatimonadaceae bacterium]
MRFSSLVLRWLPAVALLLASESAGTVGHVYNSQLADKKFYDWSVFAYGPSRTRCER